MNTRKTTTRAGNRIPGRRPNRHEQVCGSGVATRRSSRTRTERSRSAATARRVRYEQQRNDAELGRQHHLADHRQHACAVRGSEPSLRSRKAACRRWTARATRRRSSPISAWSRQHHDDGQLRLGGLEPAFLQRQGQLPKYDTQRPRYPGRELDTRSAGRTRPFETRPDLVQAGRLQQPADQPRQRRQDMYTRMGASADATFYVNAGGSTRSRAASSSSASATTSPTSSSSRTSRSTGISRGRRWTAPSSAAPTATGRGASSARSARSTSTTSDSSSRMRGRSTTG